MRILICRGIPYSRAYLEGSAPMLYATRRLPAAAPIRSLDRAAYEIAAECRVASTPRIAKPSICRHLADAACLHHKRRPLKAINCPAREGRG